MGESLKSEKLSPEEMDEFGGYSPEEVAAIVNASLFSDPEQSALFSSFIDNVHLKEQFLIQLIKVIQPQNSAFFENIIGVCETRIKESSEEQQMEE